MDKEEELTARVIPRKEEFSTKMLVKSALKFAILGGVLGACIIIFKECVSFIFNDKVHSTKELKMLLSLKTITRAMFALKSLLTAKQKSSITSPTPTLSFSILSF